MEVTVSIKDSETVEELKKDLERHGPYAVIVDNFGRRFCVAEATEGESKLKKTDDSTGVSFDYLMILEDRTDILGVVSNLLFSQIVSIEPMNREESIWVYEFLLEKEKRLWNNLHSTNTSKSKVYDEYIVKILLKQ